MTKDLFHLKISVQVKVCPKCQKILPWSDPSGCRRCEKLGVVKDIDVTNKALRDTIMSIVDKRT